MNHGDYMVDVLDANGLVVGKKRRRELNKKRDIYRAAHVLMVTPAAEVVLSGIPERQDFPNIFARRLGATAATIQRSGETADAAAVRVLREELFIRTSKLELLGEGMTVLDESYHAYLSAYKVVDEPPARFSTADIESLSVMPIEQFEAMLAENPKRFSDTLRVMWELYGDRIRGR